MRAPGLEDPMHVSIVPRGAAGGVTWLDPGEAEHFVTRSKLLASLTVAMGGRAAEKVILDGDFTQGAAGDIDAATRRVTQMVCEYGMSEIGLVAIDPSQLTGEDAARVRAVVTSMIEQAAVRADALVADEWRLTEAVAEALLEHEDLSRDQLREIAAGLTT
jgi:cell division protease FtsH